MRQRHALPREMGRDGAAHVIARGIEDQRQPPQRPERRRPVGADRPAGGCDDEGLLEEGVHLHPLARKAHLGCDDHVERPVVQRIKEPVARPGLEQEPAMPQVVGHGREETRRHLGVEILDHAQPEPGEAREVRHGKLGPRLVGLVQDRIRPAQEHLARGGQRHRPPGAVEQRRPDRPLEIGQLLAHRRSRGAQPPRGACQRGLLCGGDKDLDPPEGDAAGRCGHAALRLSLRRGQIRQHLRPRQRPSPGDPPVRRRKARRSAIAAAVPPIADGRPPV